MLSFLCIPTIVSIISSSIFIFGYISNSNLFPEPLSKDEEKKCLELYRQGNEEAKMVLIEKNLRLVAHVAKKFASSNVEQDDLVSIGTIGLIKGIESFNGEKGVRLATYASRCIENEILMYLRSNKKFSNDVYLNDTIGKDKEGNEVTLIDVLENNEKNIDEEVDNKIKYKKIHDIMQKILSAREKTIIELRFGLGGKNPKTQNEIAKTLRNITFICIETRILHMGF